MFAFLTTNTRILKRKKKNKTKNTTVLFFTTDLPPKLEKAAGNRTPSIQPGYNPLPAGCSCSCPTTPVTPALPFPPRLSQLTVHSRGAARPGLLTGVLPLPGPRLGGGSAEKRPRPALPTRNSLSRERPSQTAPSPAPRAPVATPSCKHQLQNGRRKRRTTSPRPSADSSGAGTAEPNRPSTPRSSRRSTGNAAAPLLAAPPDRGRPKQDTLVVRMCSIAGPLSHSGRWPPPALMLPGRPSPGNASGAGRTLGRGEARSCPPTAPPRDEWVTLGLRRIMGRAHARWENTGAGRRCRVRGRRRGGRCGVGQAVAVGTGWQGKPATLCPAVLCRFSVREESSRVSQTGRLLKECPFCCSITKSQRG